ncbi:phosphopantetheine-binding protein [Streptomyces sp. NPDC048664]|uniref:phosphopantetheine-binding protein n=1 Tax=Streptomyces sp. NPDC048664 TaxID=3154505 RepID=UPI003438A179
MNPTPTTQGPTDRPVRADEESVLADVVAMLTTVFDEDGDGDGNEGEIGDGEGLFDVEIGMETTFHRDLELESIDLVTLAGLLDERYGGQVNFAEFLAGMEFEEIIELTVGRLVEHVVLSLKAAEAG